MTVTVKFPSYAALSEQAKKLAVIAALAIRQSKTTKLVTAPGNVLPRCTGSTKAGRPCKSFALKGRTTCAKHAPQIEMVGCGELTPLTQKEQTTYLLNLDLKRSESYQHKQVADDILTRRYEKLPPEQQQMVLDAALVPFGTAASMISSIPPTNWDTAPLTAQQISKLRGYGIYPFPNRHAAYRACWSLILQGASRCILTTHPRRGAWRTSKINQIQRQYWAPEIWVWAGDTVPKHQYYQIATIRPNPYWRHHETGLALAEILKIDGGWENLSLPPWALSQRVADTIGSAMPKLTFFNENLRQKRLPWLIEEHSQVQNSIPYFTVEMRDPATGDTHSLSVRATSGEEASRKAFNIRPNFRLVDVCEVSAEWAEAEYYDSVEAALAGDEATDEEALVRYLADLKEGEPEEDTPPSSVAAAGYQEHLSDVFRKAAEAPPEQPAITAAYDKEHPDAVQETLRNIRLSRYAVDLENLRDIPKHLPLPLPKTTPAQQQAHDLRLVKAGVVENRKGTVRRITPVNGSHMLVR